MNEIPTNLQTGMSNDAINPALELLSISQTYGRGRSVLSVLQDANITVFPGEMVALTAQSGAGKSTVLHIAGLLDSPTSGHVRISGLNASELNDRQRTALRRTEIGFVYQFHHLLPEFSARENIMLPQMINGMSKGKATERANELLDYLKLRDRADHKPSELSGGEQQRIAIARAIANVPSILLADEPTGNLDPETSEFVFSTLQSLVHQSGLCALIATHNIELAQRMDRRVTIVDGAIVDMSQS